MSTKRKIEIEVDLDDWLKCIACCETIQSAADYRHCHKCTAKACVSCISKMADSKCPQCKLPGGLVEDKAMADLVFPKLTTKCSTVECGAMVVDLERHSTECLYRQVPCILCAKQSIIATINDHYSGCRRWKVVKLAEFDTIMHDILRIAPAELPSVGYVMDLSGKTKDTTESKHPIEMLSGCRILRIWCDATTVFMYCIQLSTACTEKMTYLFTGEDADNTRKIAAPIWSLSRIHEAVASKISLTELKEYAKFEINAGAKVATSSESPFVLSRVYHIMRGDGQMVRARLIEILADGTGTFVDLGRNDILTIPLASLASGSHHNEEFVPGHGDDSSGIAGFMAMLGALSRHPSSQA